MGRPLHVGLGKESGSKKAVWASCAYERRRERRKIKILFHPFESLENRSWQVGIMRITPWTYVYQILTCLSLVFFSENAPFAEKKKKR